jgi:RHS repeat-associated protein
MCLIPRLRTRLSAQPVTINNLSICFLLLTVLIIYLPVSAQEKAPQRGFQPGNSYSISDIESINTTNGNLILNIPLGSLPSGRGGLSGGYSIRYNGKLYDSQVAELNDDSNQLTSQNIISYKDDSGWKATDSITYQLIIQNRSSVEGPYDCTPNGGVQNLRSSNIWKVKVEYPDGGEREFRPYGFSDSALLDGYFPLDPLSGQILGVCGQASTTAANSITYFSTDGTYTRLTITRREGGVDWILSFPDGSRIVSNATSYRFYDRNGNFLTHATVHLPNGHDVIGLVDEFGRYVATETVGNDDFFYSKGFNDQSLVWKVTWKHIYVLKSGYRTTGAISGRQRGGTSTQSLIMNLKVVDKITLPTQLGNLTYQFAYNAADYDGVNAPTTDSLGWGQVSGITLPSGAQVTYEYERDGGSVITSTTRRVLDDYVKHKKLTYLTEYDGTQQTQGEDWFYSVGHSGTSITEPDGGITTHSFNDTTIANSVSGIVYKDVLPDGAIIERRWEANSPSTTTGFPASQMGANYYVKTEYRSIPKANGQFITAIKDFEYDKNGNVTSEADYDWVPYTSIPRGSDGKPDGLPSANLLSKILKTYYNAPPTASDSSQESSLAYWNANAPLLRSQLASTEVRDVTNTQLARAEFFYDDAGLGTTGNLTEQKSWDSTKGFYSSPLTSTNSISITNLYNLWASGTTGKLVESKDAKGVKTHFTYGSVGNVTDLYITKVESAYQLPIQRTSTSEYDFTSGLKTKVTDADNNVSTLTTYDEVGRPTLVQAAVNTDDETRTATEYFDVERRVVTRSDLKIKGDGKLVSISHYDQLGRIRLQRRLEDSSDSQSFSSETAGIKVQTRYLTIAGNSYVLTSNAYRAATSTAAGSESTMGWTLIQSDIAGRIVEVKTFEGTGLPAPWGSSTSSTGAVTMTYDGYLTTVTDQAQKLRRSKVDSLGRLVRVDEPVTVSGVDQLGDDPTPLQPTNYSYDALGNLRTVTQPGTTLTGSQGNQTRTFEYDSLSRLKSATNPESGTIQYQYDDVGNLTKKIDSRTLGQSGSHVETNYQYDELNRNKIVTFNDGTPAVNRYFDGAIKGKGQFWYEQTCSQTSNGICISGTTLDRREFTEYDALGRARSLKQVFTSNSVDYEYFTSRSYNLAGLVTAQKYPSSRSVTYNYDSAGRLADEDSNHLAFSGNLGDGQPRTYSSAISYAAPGQLLQEQFGTNVPVFNGRLFNSRQQLVQVSATSDSTFNTEGGHPNFGGGHPGLLGQIVNDYGSGDNNGNLKQQAIWVPANQLNTGGAGGRQYFSYDSLNRLTGVTERDLGDAYLWAQSYKYDSWGNRVIDMGGPTNTKTYEVDWQHNQLKVPANQTGTITYDAAGNLIADSYTGIGMPSAAAYDANNKMISAQSGPDTVTYGYSADGSRVRRKIVNLETWQIYGFDGELLAEYGQDKTPINATKEYGYRNGELLVTANNSTVRANVASSANGATATSSSDLSLCGSSFPARGAIDGDRLGSYWGQGGGWADSSSGNFQSDSLEVNFGSSRTIDEIDVFTIQDTYAQPSPPTETMTFSLYGLTQYKLQYLDGSTWTDVPGASVTGNNKVWRKFTFSPLTTTKLKLIAQAAVDNGYSRIAEIEAWGNIIQPAKTNVALRSNGATATASSELTASCQAWKAAGTIDGDRLGQNWGSGGGWADANAGNFQNDWLLVEFNGAKTIDEVDVFTVQDGCTQNIYYQPTEAMTFSSYGLTEYKLQYLNGPAWTDIPGASVTNNNKVWKRFTFPALTTTKIRLVTQAASDNGYSRVAEIEAWSPNQNAAADAVQWLVSDQLGTPRLVVDQSGTLAGVKRHDYLPFGEELPGTSGFRTTAQGYSSGDGVRQQFTSKERDVETGLDYFLARYYSSTQGRFTSPDLAAGKRGNPQTLNRYSYVKNNPLKYIDPFGYSPQDPKKCPECENKEADAEIIKIDSAKLPWYKRTWSSIKKAIGKAADTFLKGQEMEMQYTMLQSAGTVRIISDAAPVLREVVESNPQLMGGTQELPFFQPGVLSLLDESSESMLEESDALQNLLTAGLEVPNAGGVIRSFVTAEEEVYYRVFSENSVGQFLTKVPPTTSASARQALALPPGNQATFIQEVVVPAGTRLQRSRALPAFGQGGGAEQFRLLQKIPNSSFGPARPLP